MTFLKEQINKKNRNKIDKTDFNLTEININEQLLSKLKDKKIIKDYFFNPNYILINGDCNLVMEALINDGVKVDHIITDIPYGTVQGLAIEGWKNKGNIPEWDEPIDLEKMFENTFKISRANSNLLLFSQEPMTFKLNYHIVLHQKYSLSNKMIWVKNNHANAFSAKTTPINYYEEILLIRKSLDESNSVALRNYFKNMLEYIGVSKKEIMEELGQGLDHCFRYLNRTFYIPTKKNYSALIDRYKINAMPNFIPYEKLKSMWDKENKTIFNLPKNEKIYKNVLSYSKDTNNIHPTQKPLSLLRDLIRTFSNKNDLILDFTSGSGSTGIAAIEEKRRFVGIELDDSFYLDSIKWYNEYLKNKN